MPPHLKRRQPGERPPPPKLPPAQEPEEEIVSGPETVGEYDVVVIDDETEEAPDLTIDVQEIADRHQARRRADRPATQRKPAGNPFLPRYSIIDKIRP